MVVLLGMPKQSACQTGPTASMCDTAVRILQDFVRGGDFRLGFKDTAEFAGAAIDTSEGLRLGYEDASEVWFWQLTNDSIAHLHRIMYPVYAQGKLHSAIMFDSTPRGWIPIRFADGREIRRYCEFMKHDPRARRSCMLVYSESLHGDYLISTAADGSRSILLPTPLAQRIQRHLPDDLRNTQVIPVRAFIDARKKMLPTE